MGPIHLQPPPSPIWTPPPYFPDKSPNSMGTQPSTHWNLPPESWTQILSEPTTTTLPEMSRKSFKITNLSKISSLFWVWENSPPKKSSLSPEPERSNDSFPSHLPLLKSFTGTPGRYVQLKDTIKGFTMILDGEMDSIPEVAFYMVGDIEEVRTKAAEIAASVAADAENL